MTDKGASVLALLKQKADKIVNAQNYLQLFCEEEFIRRLSKSKYADNFILKVDFSYIVWLISIVELLTI